MKITVVTVCFNEEKNISRTIESVLQQTSRDFEYIICDGMSKDRTVEIAKKYYNLFAEKGIEYNIYSEKDKGIYDAMNKGILKAQGEYIYFLNAGDWLYDGQVLEKVVEYINTHEYMDVLYGNVAVVERGIVSFGIGNHENLEKAMSIAHPASFTSTSLMRENLFDTRFKIAADYNFFLSMKQQNKIFAHIETPISFFEMGGVSTVNARTSIQEELTIFQSHGIKVDKAKLYYQKYRMQIVYRIKNLMPKKMWEYWSCKIKKRELVDTSK